MKSLVLLLFAGALACERLLEKQSQEEALAVFQAEDIESSDECLLELLNRDWWEVATQLVSKAVLKGQEVSEEVRKKATDRKRAIEKLIQTIDSKAKINRVIPAYQWAQSPDKVFIDVKFAHRMDSPGCLEITNESITLEEDRIKFLGFCTQSNHRIRFDLDLELYAKIVPESSTHTLSSVGRLTFTLTKAETAAWTQPGKGKKASNVQIWWEMKERYQKEMDKLTGEGDEDEPDRSGLGNLLNNPNVVIKDSTVNGKRVDNTKDREL